jgi:hypothetical protein
MALDVSVRNEIKEMLKSDPLLLGSIYNVMESGVTNALEIVESTTASNRGVVYNYQKMISAILEGKIPNSASISRNAARSISRLIKNSNSVSVATLDYLNATRGKLMENAESETAVLHDKASIEAQSEALVKVASTIKNGIYVYSFPTYLHYGTIEDQEVFWLKIGSTKNSVWQRIVEQNRQTSMPEDPKLLRIYHKDPMDIDSIEQKFHTTLEKVGHERSAARRTKAGKEWFATTLEAVDAIADLMELEIERYEIDDTNL